MRALRLLCTLLLAATAHAQTADAPPTGPEPNGIVTGRVFCVDTGLPARFALVSLHPVNPAKSSPQKSSGTRTRPTYTISTSSVQTALDGSYIFSHVPPGVYYISVEEDGYINPAMAFTGDQLNSTSPQVRAALVDQVIQHITVEQDSTVRADVQLQRGAAVSGTITYDDGSAASGITIAVLTKNEKGDWRVPSDVAMFFATNDRGYFRMSSLLPGTYVLEANLNIGINKSYSVQYGPDGGQTFSHRVFESAISFYGHGTPYIDDATTFTLRGDEERTGQDMILPISKLHKLTGRVIVESSGHSVNAATVELLSDTNKKAIASSSIEREDGLFHFEFVPEGDYILRVTNARDVTLEKPAPSGIMPLPFGFPGTEKEHVVESYGNVDMPLVLRADMTGIIATVPAKQNASTAASK